ncbi:MAG: DUF368 domain-containing protein [Bifidobacteriaceae bacterium]|nr:DUF368 domain-containing protein [Bifidobacteriaceae bacterium]
MLITAIRGFCMALADSVPGVSGGTVAFLLGFYDTFIGSIHNLLFGTHKERKAAVRFLLRLGCGWIIGMALAVVVLSALFESHIYVVSSVFLGFVLGGIPVVILEEQDSLSKPMPGVFFGILGCALVVGITCLSTLGDSASMDLSAFDLGGALRLLLIGAAAISAMFLPGISGSTILLICGVYLPVMTAMRRILGLDFASVPMLLSLALGAVIGALSVVKLIRRSLERFRPQTMYCVLGMMVGSLYAIWMGPTTFDNPQPAMSIGTVNIVGCIVGFVIVAGMQWLKAHDEATEDELIEQARERHAEQQRHQKSKRKR